MPFLHQILSAFFKFIARKGNKPTRISFPLSYIVTAAARWQESRSSGNLKKRYLYRLIKQQGAYNLLEFYYEIRTD